MFLNHFRRVDGPLATVQDAVDILDFRSGSVRSANEKSWLFHQLGRQIECAVGGNGCVVPQFHVDFARSQKRVSGEVWVAESSVRVEWVEDGGIRDGSKCSGHLRVFNVALLSRVKCSGDSILS